MSCRMKNFSFFCAFPLPAFRLSLWLHHNVLPNPYSSFCVSHYRNVGCWSKQGTVISCFSCTALHVLLPVVLNASFWICSGFLVSAWWAWTFLPQLCKCWAPSSPLSLALWAVSPLVHLPEDVPWGGPLPLPTLLQSHLLSHRTSNPAFLLHGVLFSVAVLLSGQSHD